VQITLLYFAALRDAVGVSEEQLSLDDGRTVSELLGLLDQRPELSGKLGSVRVAINEAFAARDERFADGDRVALIPPVQGG
jgi:molybdopterin synthase sulfur carrier subunit